MQLWEPGDIGYDPNNLFRNSRAKYFLPSVDEWYKAAYYDPVNGVYYDYPTGSDTAPTSVVSGTAAGTAVYGHPFATGPADITQARGLSPYGTMGQGGNVLEWEETAFDLTNDSATEDRGFRSGVWFLTPNFFLSSYRVGDRPAGTASASNTSFRVASIIPEPTTSGLAVIAALFLAMRKRRVQ